MGSGLIQINARMHRSGYGARIVVLRNTSRTNNPESEHLPTHQPVGNLRHREPARKAQASPIVLSMAIMAAPPGQRLIRVPLENVRYHQARFIKLWQARSDRRIRCHFSSHTAPISGQLKIAGARTQAGRAHKRHASFKDFRLPMLEFPCRDGPENGNDRYDAITENSRLINPTKFELLT